MAKIGNNRVVFSVNISNALKKTSKAGVTFDSVAGRLNKEYAKKLEKDARSNITHWFTGPKNYKFDVKKSSAIYNSITGRSSGSKTGQFIINLSYDLRRARHADGRPSHMFLELSTSVFRGHYRRTRNKFNVLESTFNNPTSFTWFSYKTELKSRLKRDLRGLKYGMSYGAVSTGEVDSDDNPTYYNSIFSTVVDW